MVINWFEPNLMKSIASNPQAMIMKPSLGIDSIMVDINGQNAQPSNCLKLLDIYIDDELRFPRQASDICTGTARQMMLSMNEESNILSANTARPFYTMVLNKWIIKLSIFDRKWHDYFMYIESTEVQCRK